MSRKMWSSGDQWGSPTSNSGHSTAETDHCVIYIFFNVKFTEGYYMFDLF